MVVTDSLLNTRLSVWPITFSGMETGQISLPGGSRHERIFEGYASIVGNPWDLTFGILHESGGVEEVWRAICRTSLFVALRIVMTLFFATHRCSLNQYAGQGLSSLPSWSHRVMILMPSGQEGWCTRGDGCLASVAVAEAEGASRPPRLISVE